MSHLFISHSRAKLAFNCNERFSDSGEKLNQTDENYLNLKFRSSSVRKYSQDSFQNENCKSFLNRALKTSITSSANKKVNKAGNLEHISREKWRQSISCHTGYFEAAFVLSRLTVLLHLVYGKFKSVRRLSAELRNCWLEPWRLLTQFDSSCLTERLKQKFAEWS